jgi:DNA-binding MarR family transcriptional regulator
MPADPKYIDAWGSLLRIQSVVVAAIEQELKLHGEISLTWYDVLLVLDKAPEKRLRMSEVANRIVLSRSAVTRSVDRLEDEGYLRRERCGHDERGAYAVLTPKGARALSKARPVYWAGITKHFAGSLTETEISTLDRILTKVLDAFEGKEVARR